MQGFLWFTTSSTYSVWPVRSPAPEYRYIKNVLFTFCSSHSIYILLSANCMDYFNSTHSFWSSLLLIVTNST